MKIAIPVVNDSGLDSKIESRFGRANGFLIHDTESGENLFIDNQQNLNAAQGAGIQAAQNVVKAGADILLAPNCGPKAFATLKAANLTICLTNGQTTAREALTALDNEEIKPVDNANVEGHWM